MTPEQRALARFQMMVWELMDEAYKPGADIGVLLEQAVRLTKAQLQGYLAALGRASAAEAVEEEQP